MVRLSAVPPASAALRLGTGLTHAETPTSEVGAVEVFNGSGGVFFTRHLDKTEAPGLARVAVLDNFGGTHFAVSFEKLAKFIILNLEVKVRYVNVHVVE